VLGQRTLSRLVAPCGSCSLRLEFDADKCQQGTGRVRLCRPKVSVPCGGSWLTCSVFTAQCARVIVLVTLTRRTILKWYNTCNEVVSVPFLTTICIGIATFFYMHRSLLLLLGRCYFLACGNL
jgi:hypothetical protein